MRRYDPSNPVVKYSGSLKDLECDWMQRETEGADLVLVMGTSLGGLFADQVAVECAMRALRGASLGAVLINLQQTPEDDKMTLKISGKSDDVLVQLLAELGLPALHKSPRTSWPAAECALVPYDAHGQLLPEGSAQPRMWLDLRPGAKIKLCKHHNCQGARQPNSIHIGSKRGQKFNGKAIANAGQCPGLGAVVRWEDATASVKLTIEGTSMRLGVWWLEAAARGGPALLPIVNQQPAFEGAPDPSGSADRKPSVRQSVTPTGGGAEGSGRRKRRPPSAR